MTFYLIPDTDGKTNIKQIVSKQGPLLKIVKLPAHVSDVNDWLIQGGTQDQFERVVKRAKSYIELRINEVALLQGQERDEGLKEIFQLLTQIKEPFAARRLQDICQRMFNFGKREFNRILKEAQQTQEGNGNEQLTEPNIRDMWIDNHPDTLYGLGYWRRYEHGFWPIVTDDIVEREIMNILEKCEEYGPSCTDSHVKSVSALARRKLFTPADWWDRQDAGVLICSNGVLNLKTMQIEPHNKEHYATTGLGYDYDPTAKCDNFTQALNDTIQNSVEFVQEFAGYCLTTRTELETAVWFYGQPGSGKSTIIEGIRAMLGVKAGVLSLERLITNPRFALVNVPGKTLLLATESADYIQSTEIIKTIISGEPVDFERKHKDQITFRPVAKILWAMERLPRVGGGGGDGLFRRIKVVQFPPLRVKEDVSLKGRIRKERAGILNWAIEGLKRLDSRGHFELPAAVRVSTKMWSIISDKAALFVNEWCNVHLDDSDFKVDTTKRLQSDIMYAHYKDWCSERNYRPESIHRMANEWRRLGFIGIRAKSGNAFWLGVSLKPINERIEYGF